MTAAAVYEDVHKTYKTGLRGGVAALRGVTLSIPSGKIFGLLGPNRAGKTTLVKLLLSLTRPTTGQVNRLGEPVTHRHTLGRIGYMHENHAFPRYLSATEVLSFYGGLSGVPTEELPQRVEKWLERVGLADRRHEPISRFSKGMVQRLGLAQAMLNDPDLLILDEPTEGLDLTGRKLMRDVTRELRSSGRTVVLVSHVLPEIEELCDQAAVVVAGKLAWQGTLAELTRTQKIEPALAAIYSKGAAE
jgi:ABC-2 type transport system ATP-binding protein